MILRDCPDRYISHNEKTTTSFIFCSGSSRTTSTTYNICASLFSDTVFALVALLRKEENWLHHVTRPAPCVLSAQALLRNADETANQQYALAKPPYVAPTATEAKPSSICCYSSRVLPNRKNNCKQEQHGPSRDQFQTFYPLS